MTEEPEEKNQHASDGSLESYADLPKQDPVKGLKNPEVIFDRKDPHGRITIWAASDKMKAVLKVTALSSVEHYSAEDVLKVISGAGITAPVNKEAIISGLASLKQDGDQTDFVLKGHSAIPGKDGKCELMYPPDNPCVEKGQVIARLWDAIAGSPGQNIYGEAIGVALPKAEYAAAGENVTKGKDNEFYSKIAGKAVFSNNILSVQKVLDIKVSPDHLEARLTYSEKGRLSPEHIKEELRLQKVIYGIDEQAIMNIVELFNATGNPLKDAIVARGTPCRPGRDGEIKYLFQKTKGLTLHEHIEDGVIIQGPNIIKSVEKDAEIAAIIPPEDPAPGKDVYGRTIPALQKAKKAVLRPGKNVRISADGLHFIAETSGLPVIERETLSVSEVLRIAKLNYTVGNIDFDGIVEIFGDVADGFKVKASKSIIIQGVVGACDLEAGLDIQIDGGCNGQKKSRIMCEGNLKAKYLEGVFVQARGDILVKNEIVDSEILCLGRVIIRSGAVYGGSITAKKGIEAFNVGNDVGFKTKLFPGDDFELNEEIRQIEEKIAEKNRELVAISRRIGPLLKNKELLKSLPEEARAKLKETVQHLSVLREERDSLNRYKDDLLSRDIKDAVPEVVVHRYIYTGVMLKIGKTRRQVGSMLEGPLRFYEGNEVISVEPYSKKPG